MKKYRVSLQGYLTIEAESAGQAAREVEARQEVIEKSQTLAEDLLVNSYITGVEEYPDD